MANNTLGMNPDEVKAFAQLLNQKADELNSTVSQLTSKLGSTSWTGPDATKFRGDWSSVHANALRKVADELKTTATQANKNADQQISTSNAL